MNKYLLFFVLMFAFWGAFGQSTQKVQKLFEKTLVLYQQNNYEAAISNAEKILKLDSTYFNAQLLLAEIYRRQGNTTKEINYLTLISETNNPNYYKAELRLGNIYFAQGFYDKAVISYKSCLQFEELKQKTKNTVEEKIQNCEFALSLIENPVATDVRGIGDRINTSSNEYWPSLTIEGDKMVFTRLNEIPDRPLYKQEDFYESQFIQNKWDTASAINDLNTPENEGAQTISADGRFLFFTACNRPDGIGRCDIYFSHFENGSWSNPVNVGAPVNSSAWESQPSISANATVLYFVSNRQGGKGAMDIWSCEINGIDETGKPVWGVPKNLGENINSPGNELSPFIHFNGIDLYFSSDYWQGLGKHDIFKSTINTNSGFSQATNIGYPINTNNDEQGFIVDALGEMAYFSSDRIIENGLDIFSAKLNKELQVTPVTYLKARILDAKTKAPLKAKVDLFDLKTNTDLKVNIVPDNYGEFILCLPLGIDYAFNISHDGYLFYSESFELEEVFSVAQPFEKEILLNPVKVGETVILQNIYFDTDSYTLLSKSLVEINKLIDFLVKNPSLVVEIGGHTDDVGTEEYNNELSVKRAKAVYEKVVQMGIDEQMLTYKGYGFSVPIVANNSEFDKQKNRRTEVKIIK